MDLFEALKFRRTANKWDVERALSQKLISRLIEAATWAPNHRLTEPWRFYVLSGGAREGVIQAINLDYQINGYSDEKINSELGIISRKLHRSPVVVIVTQFSESNVETRLLEDYAACACAIQNLLLAAHSEGLASKWSTGDLVYERGVRNFLNLSDQESVVGYIFLGFKLEKITAEPNRKSPKITWYGF